MISLTHSSNRKADKHHGCKGDSYYDYHRDCCACSNNKYYYFSVEETCGSCGPEAYYDYDHNSQSLQRGVF
jgi:hypothetical protein